MTPEDFARQSWHAAAAPALPAVETLRARSDAFRRKIARRNALEYAAGALVVAGFGFTMVILPMPLMQLACAMIIATTIHVLWQLHRRGASLPGDSADGALPVLVQQRAALSRQRDALKNVFGWYLAPYLPGMALFFAVPVVTDPPALGTEAFIRVAVSAAFLVIVPVAIWWVNQVAARDLQRQVDEIDALIAG